MRKVIAWLVVLVFVVTGCAKEPVFEQYEESPLEIAVVGEPPKVREEQVEFTKISFDDMTSKKVEAYDAVIITEKNLLKASKKEYAKTYLDSTIPFFFISAKSHIPFTTSTTEYNDSWNWTAGSSYAVGVLGKNNEKGLTSWEYSIHNDEIKKEHIEYVYSRIFTTIFGLQN